MVENDESAAPYEMVTKLQAAKRQLQVGIRLFFERRDLVAVHTLAAAAQEILRALGRPRGIKSVKDYELVRPERQEEITKLFNQAQNFFKHAGRDPDEQLKFYYGTTPFYLIDAVILYNRLTGQQFPLALDSSSPGQFFSESQVRTKLVSRNRHAHRLSVELQNLALAGTLEREVITQYRFRYKQPKPPELASKRRRRTKKDSSNG